MTAAEACRLARELAFDQRADGLSEIDAQFVGDHIARCADCADWYARLDDVLTAPLVFADQTASRIDADALFAGIAARLEPGSDTEVLSIAQRSPTEDDPNASEDTALFDEIGPHGAGRPRSTSTADSPEGGATIVVAGQLSELGSAGRMPAGDDEERTRGGLLALPDPEHTRGGLLALADPEHTRGGLLALADPEHTRGRLAAHAPDATLRAIGPRAGGDADAPAPKRGAGGDHGRYAGEVSSAELEPLRGNRSLALAVAVAAVLAAALAFGLTRAGRSDRPSVDTVPVAAVAPVRELPRREAPSRSVELRASTDAIFELDEPEDGPRVLRVDAGFVIVEYLPIDDRGLSVRAGALSFHVTGTVFYVDASGHQPELGVLVGSVEVAQDGAVGVVRAGERHARGSTYPLSASDREAFESLVDIPMHRARLATLATLGAARASDSGTEDAAPERSPRPAASPAGADAGLPRAPERAPPHRATTLPPPTLAAPPEEPSEEPPNRPAPGAAAYEEATRAMRDRRWADAARAYEQVVRERGPDPALRLDLASLYTRRLEQPVRAAEHLRAFVTEFPSDPATDVALRELCRISRSLERAEPLCP